MIVRPRTTTGTEKSIDSVRRRCSVYVDSPTTHTLCNILPPFRSVLHKGQAARKRHVKRRVGRLTIHSNRGVKATGDTDDYTDHRSGRFDVMIRDFPLTTDLSTEFTNSIWTVGVYLRDTGFPVKNSTELVDRISKRSRVKSDRHTTFPVKSNSVSETGSMSSRPATQSG